MRSEVAVIVLLVASCSRPSELEPRQRGTLLDELRQCREELRLVASTPVESACANRSVYPLNGLTRSEVAAALGDADWWVGTDGLITLDTQLYRESRTWGYSFYRLPEDSLGGGPELTFEFDGHARAKVSWLWSQ